jgi:hypothetical protein
VLARYGHLEEIPQLAKDWDVQVRGAVKLATTLSEQREDADLFKVLATLRDDADVGTVDEWRWTGPEPNLGEWAERLGSPRLVERAEKLAAARS